MVVSGSAAAATCRYRAYGARGFPAGQWSRARSEGAAPERFWCLQRVQLNSPACRRGWHWNSSLASPRATASADRAFLERQFRSSVSDT